MEFANAFGGFYVWRVLFLEKSHRSWTRTRNCDDYEAAIKNAETIVNVYASALAARGTSPFFT